MTMPTTCRITGNVSTIGLTPAAGLVLLIAPDPRTVQRSADVLVVPEPVSVVVSESGRVDVQLLPGRYTVSARQGASVFGKFAITVPSATVATIAQLLDAPAPPTLNAAQQAVLDAQSARDAANASAAAAGVSATGAAAARTSAEAARDAAAASATGAAASASAASASEDAAAASETAAAGSATAAAGSASTATTQAGLAAAARTGAEGARDTAQAAAASATGAFGSAAAAAAARDAAQAAQTGAEAARDASVTARAASQAAQAGAESAKASAESARDAAASSETAAAASASGAARSASTATAQAGIATTKAGEAAASATGAAGSATAAASARDGATGAAATATTKASEAAASAAAAAASETAAAGSASAAATSAQNIEDSYGGLGDILASADAAATSAEAAEDSADAASTSAAASAASALIASTYAVASGLDTATKNAQAAASLAQGYAASAASVIQQDLSGVTAQALHRSPNAITALHIYDTSKDSDGGAWTKRCQHTSWYNEALAGKWLGAQVSEFAARNAGGTLGTELVNQVNTNTAVWDAGGTNTIVLDGTDGIKITHSNTSTGQFTLRSSTNQLTANLTVGKTYAVSADIKVNSGSSVSVRVQDGSGSLLSQQETITNTTFERRTFLFAAVNASSSMFQFLNFGTGEIIWFRNISVREVTALNTASNDYFQLTTDGKFYRLWKNLITHSADFTNASWPGYNGWSASSSTVVNVSAGGASTRKTLSNIIAGQTYTLTADVQKLSGGVTGISCDIGDGNPVSIVLPTAGIERKSITLVAGPNLNFLDLVANNSGSFYISNVQLEYGSTATTYEAKAAEGSTSEIFRGNKAEFPKLAAIVAEASNVTIYDLTDNTRPMFMRFISTATATLASKNMVSGSNAVFATNGRIAIGGSGTNLTGLTLVDLVRDYAELRQTSGYVWNGGVSSRNSTGGYGAADANVTGIANATVNALAVTVLPDAPINPATGLRVPTIAVATAGGVSVIKHDGTVTNPTAVQSFNISFDSRNNVVFHIGENFKNYRKSYPPYTSMVSFVGGPFAFGGSVNTMSIVSMSKHTGKTLALARSIANYPNLIRDNDRTPGATLGASIAPTYNTGWMTGDVRRCYLSDATAESIGPSAELVTNGTFDTDTSGWTASTANVSAVRNSSGQIEVTNNGAGLVYQAVTVVVGRTYLLSGNFVVRNGSGRLNIGLAIGGTTYASVSAAGNVSLQFTATASTVYISIGDGAGGTGVLNTYDNISVRECVADRSYKASVASITGTLTKAALATGTSLVGYSGFSASNYLREPYSADLDFGTGEWTASAWVNVPSSLPTGSTELVTNGNFATDISGWTAVGGSTLTWVAGALKAANTAINEGARQYITTEVGKVYIVKGTLSGGSFGRVWVNGAAYVAAGAFEVRFTATAISTEIRLSNSEAPSTQQWDNISAKETVPSVVFERAFSSGARFRLGVGTSGQMTAEAFDGTTTRTVTSTAAYNTATWLKTRVSYSTDGSLRLSVNGVEVAATRGTPLLTLNNSSAVLTIGNSYALDAPFPGSIALLKLGATVPTPEQAQFMYEQEKQLFRAGAQSVLPDTGSIVDMAYDDATDRWVAVSAANESYWTGLVRNAVTPVPAGSYSKIVATSGVELTARSTTNPGVDVTIPAYGLREELVRRAEAAARLTKEIVTYDFVGGFTANTTNGSTAITNASTITYPSSYIGARISGSGIPANTTIVGVSGTTLYLSAAATATATAVSISFLDFALPAGMETRSVFSAGIQQREGSTAAYTRLFDGFVESVRFAVAPGATALVTLHAQRITQQ